MINRFRSNSSIFRSHDLTKYQHYLSHDLSKSKVSRILILEIKYCSSRRTLLPYLDLYGFQAETIPSHSFLAPCHCTKKSQQLGSNQALGGFCQVRRIDRDEDIVDFREVPIFDDIHLIRILKDISQAI